MPAILSMFIPGRARKGPLFELLNVIIDFLRSCVVHLLQLFLSRAQHLQRERHGKQLNLYDLILMPCASELKGDLWLSFIAMHQTKSFWVPVGGSPVLRSRGARRWPCPLVRGAAGMQIGGADCRERDFYPISLLGSSPIASPETYQYILLASYEFPALISVSKYVIKLSSADSSSLTNFSISSLFSPCHMFISSFFALYH